MIGIDAPAVDGALNALVPRARARVSVRLAPGQDPAEATGGRVEAPGGGRALAGPRHGHDGRRRRGLPREDRRTGLCGGGEGDGRRLRQRRRPVRRGRLDPAGRRLPCGAAGRRDHPLGRGRAALQDSTPPTRASTWASSSAACSPRRSSSPPWRTRGRRAPRGFTTPRGPVVYWSSALGAHTPEASRRGVRVGLGARLEIAWAGLPASRVRIPPSPPLTLPVSKPRACGGDGEKPWLRRRWRVADVMQIKGYTTLAEDSEATGIPAEEFVAVFGVSTEEMGACLSRLSRTRTASRPGTCGSSSRLACTSERTARGERRAKLQRVRGAAAACYTTRPRPPVFPGGRRLAERWQSG